MTSAFTNNIGLEEPALGDYVNSWSTPVNANWSLIDQKFGSYTLISVTGGTLNPTVAQAAYAFLSFIGVLGSNQIVILPTTGFWFVNNNTTGAFTLTVKGGVGDTGIQIPTGGLPQLIYSTGTNASTPVNYANIVEGLGFTPANKAGDTFSGAVTFSNTLTANSTATFNSTTTVPTVATGDVSTNAASTALVAAKIAAVAPVAPQTTVYTSGSGTYATPAGALYLEVEMVGAGSGGGGAGAGSSVGTAGGATTFGGMTANGGNATPAYNSTTHPAAATALGGNLNISGALGGNSAVINTSSVGAGQVPSGADCPPFGTGGVYGYWNNSGVGQAATGFGAGGGGASSNGNFNITSGWGGNAGAYSYANLTTPSATYSYGVGAAGSGGSAGTNGNTGGAGAPGLIKIVAHFQ